MKICKGLLTIMTFVLLSCMVTVSASAREQENNSRTISEQQSDIWIKAKLVTTYALNQHLNSFDIDVDVHNGIVTLSGEVESPVEEDLAVEIAKGISDVKEVRDELTIEPESGGSQRKATSFSQTVDDATITAKVKSRLLWNRNIEGLDITVSTKKSIVILSGRIETAVKRDLAVQLARNTPGVKEVVDQLQVTAKEESGMVQETGEKIKKEVSDAWITGKVKAVLLSSKETEGTDIEVSSHNKVVTLSGVVKSREQRDRIIALVRDVVGVATVESQLTIAGE